MTNPTAPTLPSLTDLDPATEQHISMPPALVDAAREDPEVLVQLTRAQLAVVQDRMVQRVLGNPDATIGQLATVHDALSKNAQIKPDKGVAGGGGAQVVINFIRAAEKETLTIDGATGQPLDPPG